MMTAFLSLFLGLLIYIAITLEYIRRELHEMNRR